MRVRAWLIAEEEARARHAWATGRPSTSIATWIVNGPYHPFWAWWQVCVIHLRPVLGVPAAYKAYPEAEYEFSIYSLNPEAGEPDIAALEAGAGYGVKVLTPPDVQYHFHGVTDEQAAEICRHAVRAIVDGHSCDSDYRSWWEGSLAHTVEHFVQGVHS